MPGTDNYSPNGKRKRTRRLLLGAATAAIVTVAGVAGAQALTAIQAQHFIECFGWMLSDPDTHAANCLPGHVPPLGTLSTGGDDPAHELPPPPPPPTETITQTFID